MDLNALRQPGKIRSTPATTKHSIQENARWLKAHMEAYQNQHVALLQGTLLGHGDLPALYAQFKDHPEFREIMFMKIPDLSQW